MNTRGGKNTVQVDWDYNIVKEFINRAKLNSKERFVLITRTLKVLPFNDQAKLIEELSQNKVFLKHKDKREHLYEGLTIKEQADILQCSTKTIDRIIEKLKYKYDAVQLMYPQIFKKRNVYNNMDIGYDNFEGYFRVDGVEGTEFIDFVNKKFKSFHEMRMYIINNVSEKYNKNFNEFEKLHITINMDLDLHISKKTTNENRF